jgi:hypothetical protein
MAGLSNQRRRLLLTDPTGRHGVRIDLVTSLECADAISRDDADRAGTSCLRYWIAALLFTSDIYGPSSCDGEQIAGGAAGVHVFHVLEKVEQSRGSVVFNREMTENIAMMIAPEAQLLAVLDRAEEYRGLAIRARDRNERESYERIVELYVEIAEELEALIDRWASP